MKEKVSLVLSGGGARGIAHIGVIEELEKQGYEIASIAGTSMGALIGGIYALGKLPDFKEWICSLDKLKVFRLLDFSFSAQGIIKGDKLFKTLKVFIEDVNIEDLKIPYSATATDIINKKEVVFTKGSIYNAIRASIAIPSVFTPVKIGDAILVDGGVVNNVPISNVKRVSNDILIVVDVNANTPVLKLVESKQEKIKKKRALNLKLAYFESYLKKVKPQSKNNRMTHFKVLHKTITLMMHHMSEIQIKEYNPKFLINVSRETCSTFDFYKADDLIEIGRMSAKKSLLIQSNSKYC